MYLFPQTGRSGLGNELFAWARTEVLAKRFNLPIIAPSWSKLRIGQYLRREPDKRHYDTFFYSPHHIHGLKRLLLLFLEKRISEAEAWSILSEQRQEKPRCTVVVRGLEGLFTPILTEHDYLRKQLWNMTRPAIRDSLPSTDLPFIALHVRRGDITRQGFTPEELLQVNQYTPLDWFIAMSRKLRSNPVTREVPQYVFSDGSPEELVDLLSEPGVSLHPRARAIQDLWSLSRAKLFCASGFSTFGMWASFLGRMPTLYAPGKIQQRVQTSTRNSIEIEIDRAADIPPEVFARMQFQQHA